MCPRGRRVLAGVVTVIALAATSSSAAASPTVPSSDPFYSYSGSLDQIAPGTVLRQRTVTIAESGTSTPISATQVLYRTTGQLGQPTATVATILRPATQPLVTKLVSYQTAYDALGSQCDPSYTLQGGNSSYATAQDEEQIILGYLSAGDTVVVPDYEGERLDWAAGQESGYGTLDGIRAAESLLGLSPGGTPVGMVGYSGGSIATDFA
ncbi:MAG: lipase family protein, partial [Acidimicrobiales bacterium]